MKKGALVDMLNRYAMDDAEVRIGENPKALLVIEDCKCIMIKLDGEWDYD